MNNDIDERSNIWVAGDLCLGMHRLADGSHPFVKRETGYEERFLSAAADVVSERDVLVLLGNVAVGRIRWWFERIRSEIAGRKILIIGDLDTNRPAWYEKMGMDLVVPFGESTSVTHPTDAMGLGPIMFTHLPCFTSVLTQEDDFKFRGICRKLERQYDMASPILNVHAHTMGRGFEDHRTVDAGLDVIGEAPKTIGQIFDGKHRA